MEDDPYRPPEVAEVAAEQVLSDPERIRMEHLKHETSLKGAGLLMILASLLLTFPVGYFGYIIWRISDQAPERSEIFSRAWGTLIILSVVLIAALVAGIGLRGLRPWSWIPSVVVSAITLLGFPIGTVIAGYFLYLLIAPKGRRILASDYREIVRQTPQIEYRTPLWLWLLLIGVIVLVVVLFFPSVS